MGGHKRVTSLQSVSTDATLGEDGNCSETEFSDTSPRAKALMVLFDCSVKDAAPITVKNTFVEMSVPRPLEWDGCFEDRRVRSAPGSVVVSPAESHDLPPWVDFNLDDQSDCEGDSEQDGDDGESDNSSLFVMPAMQSAPVLARPAAVTLRLAEALDPVVGFAAIPTIGSA